VDEHDAVHSMACTSEGLCELQRLKLLRNEGPWFDCVLTGAPVEARLNDDPALSHWPTFDPVAIEAGYQQVLSLPMRLRDTVVGAVNVFIASPREVPAADLHLAGALTSITTLAILNQRALRRSAIVTAQLQGALDSRLVIEQAKGMLAEHHGISVDEAFHLLRGHARSHNRRLTDVARSIANRQFTLDQFRGRALIRSPRAAEGVDEGRVAPRPG
ncbi:MAG: GAF and ANTAR domain-containing protein, partial [Nitriliruptoraceae bacterium]